METSAVKPALDNQRFASLDLMRGVAVLMILFYHTLDLNVRATSTAFENFVAMCYQYLWSGVDLFFVLSGFLITGVLVRTPKDSHFFRNFYARRILRLWPVYYSVYGATTILNYVMNRNWSPPDDFWLYWVQFANLAVALHTDRMNVFWPAWSLSVEEQFYVGW